MDVLTNNQEVRGNLRYGKPWAIKSSIPIKIFSEAHALFMILPFASSKRPPKTTLLYSARELIHENEKVAD